MSKKVTDFTGYINENFGANASYVEGLYDRYTSDRMLVDDSWRSFFDEMTSGENGRATVAAAAPSMAPTPTALPEAPAPKTSSQPAKPKSAESKETVVPKGVEPKPLTGVAKVIVENMDESLTVPTATSVRRIPVKLLEENRKVINESLLSRALGKVSFTHLIGWAIIKAANEFPSMNHGYGVVDGKPTRLETDSVNLGHCSGCRKKERVTQPPGSQYQGGSMKVRFGRSIKVLMMSLKKPGPANLPSMISREQRYR